jgi:N-acyl-D-amino-acid deacylase
MPEAAVLVSGASVLDGTGAPAQAADVLVEGSRVAATLPPGSPVGDHVRVVDAAGLVVAPGFIDVHSHADNAPLLVEDDTSKILQGVTTEVVGNCGMTLAPRTESHAAVIEQYARRLFPELPWTWQTYEELLQDLDSRGYVTNYVPLVGHHSLRIAAMGMSDRAPAAGQMRAMDSLLDEAVAAGCFGLSSGLIYPPGLFAAPEEVRHLVGRLPEDRIYTTHMRGESGSLLDSVTEALEAGRATGRRVQISHLKASGRGNWGLVEQALELVDEALASGVEVTQDVYPYTSASTMLTATLPPWFQEGGAASVMARLRDTRCLDRLRDDLEAGDREWENFVYGAGWDGIVVASSATHRFDGLSLQQVADASGLDPLQALVELLLDEELRASMIVHSMSDQDVQTVLAHPGTMIGSDGLPPGTGGKPHPRTYGTFPRVLARYVRDLGTLTLPQAVHKMTGLPAATFGLADRGRVAPGMVADLVAFDPEAIRDRADFGSPTAAPEGISWVMQRGRLVVEHGSHLGARVGERLSPGP